MKTLTLMCSRCEKSIAYHGRDVSQIISELTRVGWYNSPEEDLCPECYKDSDLYGYEIDEEIGSVE